MLNPDGTTQTFELNEKGRLVNRTPVMTAVNNAIASSNRNSDAHRAPAPINTRAEPSKATKTDLYEDVCDPFVGYFDLDYLAGVDTCGDDFWVDPEMKLNF